MHLPGARPFGLPAGFTAGLIIGGCGLLRGWSFQESTNAAGATLAIYDGTDTTGNLLAAITLSTNESTRDYPAGAGVEFRIGLYVTVTAGTVVGSLWVNAGEMVGDYVQIPGLVPEDVGL